MHAYFAIITVRLADPTVQTSLAASLLADPLVRRCFHHIVWLHAAQPLLLVLQQACDALQRQEPVTSLTHGRMLLGELLNAPAAQVLLVVDAADALEEAALVFGVVRRSSASRVLLLSRGDADAAVAQLAACRGVVYTMPPLDAASVSLMLQQLLPDGQGTHNERVLHPDAPLMRRALQVSEARPLGVVLVAALASALCTASAANHGPTASLESAVEAVETAARAPDQPALTTATLRCLAGRCLSRSAQACFVAATALPSLKPAPESVVHMVCAHALSLQGVRRASAANEAVAGVAELRQRGLLEPAARGFVGLHRAAKTAVASALGCDPIGGAAAHECVVDAYGRACGVRRLDQGPDDGYFYDHVVRHLLFAGQRSRAIRLLRSHAWLAARSMHGGLTGWQADCALMQEAGAKEDSATLPQLAEAVLKAGTAASADSEMFWACLRGQCARRGVIV